MRSDAEDSRLRLVRATRDLVGWAGSTDVSVRDIAAAAGVSVATLYRHFDGRQALIDEVSIRRWSRIEELARYRVSGEFPVDHVLRILETYTRMTTRDHRFIVGAGITTLGQKPVDQIRAAFEPFFASSWVAAQSDGCIRRTADPRDAMDMAGSVRDPERRVAMLALIAGGICTEKVDVLDFAARAVSHHWK